MSFSSFKKIIAGIVLVNMLAMGIFVFPYAKTANAQFGFLQGLIDVAECIAFDVLEVFDFFSFAAPSTAYASVPVHETALAKEGCPDIEAWFIAKILLRSLVGETINWVRSGDATTNGGPLFITNFKDHILGAGARGTTIFLSELDANIGNIAEPFRAFTLEALQSNAFNPYPHANSTIDEITDPNAFYDDFREGGSEAFLASIFEPSNNAFGIYHLERERKARQEAIEAQSDYLEAESSEGFKGDADCIQWIGDLCAKRDIQTPGSSVQDVLTRALETEFSTLEDADEIAELITAFIDRLFLSGLFRLDTSNGSLNPVPEFPSEETPPEPGELAQGETIATTSCIAGDPVNTIVWNPTSDQIPVYTVRYCTELNCTPTATDPIACIVTDGSTSCIHQNALAGITYTYRPFADPLLTGGGPVGNSITITTEACGGESSASGSGGLEPIEEPETTVVR